MGERTRRQIRRALVDVARGRTGSLPEATSNT
jgi:hypothetical protein